MDETAVKNNFSSFRGDDWKRKLFFVDENNDPVDITGWVVFMTLKSSLDLEDAEAEAAVEFYPYADPVNGEVLIHLTHDDTDIAVGKYFYDIQYQKTDSEVKTITSGIFEILQDVTRRTN